MPKSLKNSISGWAFLGGLVLIAIDAILFLIGYSKAGLLFVSGMAVICGIAFLSCIGSKNARTEDWVCMAAGFIFFGWLALKNL